MAAHRYWRINITANNGDASYLTIAEVQMRATSGGADQCTGGSASASSYYIAGYEPTKAVDDSASTYWTNARYSFTGWWQYDFGVPVVVTEYTIQGHPSAPTRNPRDFTLQYSDNGVDWTVADARSGETTWSPGETRTFWFLSQIELGLALSSISVTGAAALSLGVSLSGAISAPISGTANLDNGATLIASGLIEAIPRARLAGAEATPGAGNFFLLF